MPVCTLPKIVPMHSCATTSTANATDQSGSEPAPEPSVVDRLATSSEVQCTANHEPNTASNDRRGQQRAGRLGDDRQHADHRGAEHE